MIVAGAPGGIALSTPQHIQLSANGSQILTSAGNTEISSLQRMVLAAKRGLVAFAHELGMKLVAAAGKVTIQAQTDSMEMTAMKGITLTSTQDEIIISAQKKITLQCGGSYMTISPDKIENGCSGDFKVRSANFDYAEPATLSATMPGFTACENIAVNAASSGSSTVPIT